MNALSSQIADAKQAYKNTAFAHWINTISDKFVAQAQKEVGMSFSKDVATQPITTFVHEFVLKYQIFSIEDVGKVRYSFAEQFFGWFKDHKEALRSFAGDDVV